MNRSQQQGATLVESLVSLVILAIAVIGMLGVQMRALVETNMSSSRSQAMVLIEDLSERIKANPNRYQSLPNYVATIDAAPTTSHSCSAKPCNPSQLAAYDMQEWAKAVVSTLPGGKAATFQSTADSRQLGVLIGWKANEKDNDTAYTQPFTISTTESDTTCWDNYICHLMYVQP